MSSSEPAPFLSSAPMATRRLVQLAIPALLIGAMSAVALWLLDIVAEYLEHVLWDTAPAALGVDPAGWWVVLILTLTGIVVGLVVWLMPGHGGNDSATAELIAPTIPASAVPSVAIVVVLALAGGVSLGPEGPIIAINTAIAVAIVAKLWRSIPTQLVIVLAASGTIGALFGTPVAAALVFTSVLAGIKTGGSLWDKLFLPLVAAGAGSIVSSMLGAGMSLASGMAPFSSDNPVVAILWGTLVACVAGAFALLGVYIFPHVHAAFRKLRNPVVYAGLGGLLLGVLGLVGGPITMFKGLNESAELLANPDDFSAAQLAVIAVIKLAALVIAAAAGFRGGRIFPAIFIGVAVGMLGHALIPDLPLGLAVACGVLGLTLAVARDGWIALFVAVAITGDITLLPILCIVVLPVWLVVRLAPEMIVHPPVDTSRPPLSTV